MAGTGYRKSYKYTKNKKQNKFLNIFARTGSLRAAAAEMGIARQTHYDWIMNDDTYKMRYEQIKMQMADELEESAFERALHGHQENIRDKDGNIIDTKTIWHDGLTQFMLKGLKPEVYVDRVKQEITTDAVGGLCWEGDEDNAEDNYTVQADEAVAGDDTSGIGEA